MLKIISIAVILMLTFVLSGCNDNENVTNSLIEVKIIEDFEALGLEMPNYLWHSFTEATLNGEFHEIFWAGQSLTLSNGLTDEIEATFKVDAGQRIDIERGLRVEDYYFVKVISSDNDDPWTPTVIEILILDKNLTVVESFNITEENGVAFSGEQLGVERNEAGEWLIYLIEYLWPADDTRIYTYNLNTSELKRLLEMGAGKEALLFMPDTSQLLFSITHWIGNGEEIDYIEYGLLNLETLEVEMIPQSITDDGSWVRTPLVDGYLVFTSTKWIDEDGVVLEDELLMQLRTDEETVVTAVIETAFLFHLPTGEYQTISLEDYRVSFVHWTDGQILVTSTSESADGHVLNVTSRVMIHDIHTGELVFEYTLINGDLAEDEALEGIEFFKLADDVYLIRARVQTGINETNLLPTGRRTEYIVIEIEVQEDEQY